MNKTLSTLTLALLTAWSAQAMSETITIPTDPETVPSSTLKASVYQKIAKGQTADLTNVTINNPNADLGVMLFSDPNGTGTVAVTGPVSIDVTSDKINKGQTKTQAVTGAAIQLFNVNASFNDDVTLNSTTTNTEKTDFGGSAFVASGDLTQEDQFPAIRFEKGLTINYTTKNDANPSGGTASQPNSALFMPDTNITAHDVDLTAKGSFSDPKPTATKDIIISGLTNTGKGKFTSEGDHFNIHSEVVDTDGNAKGIYLFGSTPEVEINNHHVVISAKADATKDTWSTGTDIYRESKLTINSDDLTVETEGKDSMGMTIYNKGDINVNAKNDFSINAKGNKTYGVFTSTYKGSSLAKFQSHGDKLSINSQGAERAVGMFLWVKSDFTLDSKNVDIQAGSDGNTKKGEGLVVMGASTFKTTENNDNFKIDATETTDGGKGMLVTGYSTVDLKSKNVDITMNRQSTRQSYGVSVEGSTLKTSHDTAFNVKSTSTNKQNLGLQIKGQSTVELAGNNSIVTVSDGNTPNPMAAAVKTEGNGATINIGSADTTTYIGAQTTDAKDWDNATQAGNAFLIEGGQEVNILGKSDIVGDGVIDKSKLNIQTTGVENRWKGKDITVQGATAELNWTTHAPATAGTAMTANVTAKDGAQATLIASRDKSATSIDGEMRDRLIDNAQNGNIDLTLNNASWKARGISTINSINGTNAQLDMTAHDVNNVFIQEVNTPLTISMDLNPAKRAKTGVLYTHTLGPDGKLIFDFADIETVDLTKTYENPLRFATTMKNVTKDKIEVLNFPEKSADGLYTYHWDEDKRPDAADDNDKYMGLADQLTPAEVAKLIPLADQKYWVITADLNQNAPLDRFALPKHLWWNMDSYDERQGGIKVDPQHRNLWVRARGEWADEARFTDAQVRSLTYDVGYSRELNNEWKASVFGEYREATATFQTVDAKTHAYRWGAGVIFTRTRDRDYLDIVGRFTRDNLKMVSLGSNARPHMNSWMASVEYGRHYQYENGRYLVPQIQGTILRMKTKNYHWEGGSVTSDHVDAYGLRLGLKAGIDKPKYGVWARADLLPSFDGKQAVYVNVQGTTLTQTTSNYGLGFDLGVGAHRFLNQNWTLTGSAFYNRTPGVKRAFRANVNVTRTF